jgi:hypothetical protein
MKCEWGVHGVDNLTGEEMAEEEMEVELGVLAAQV